MYFRICTFSILFCGAFLFFPKITLASNCQSNVTSGNWSVAGTWTNCGGVTPQTTDTIQIQAGHTVTINGSNRQVAGVQVDGSGILANGGFTLTDTGTGTGVNGFTINGTLSGTGATIISGAGITIDGTGNITATGITTISNTATIASTADLTFSGTIAISGAITVTNNGSVTTNGTAGITGSVAGSTWTQGTNSTLNFGGNTTSLLLTGTLNASSAGNTINYKGTAQTCKVVTYYNVTFSGSGTKTCAATTINGNLTVSGTASWTTGTTALTVSGITTVSGGTLALSGGTGNKIFVGLVTVSSGTLSGTATVNFFRGGITRTAGTVSLTGTATFDTNAQDLNGTIAIATVTVTGVTVTNYGTLTASTSIAGTGGLTNETTGTINYGASAAPTITTLTSSATGSTFNYNRAGTQTCKVMTYYHLGFSGSSAKTCAIATINGNLTVSGTATWTMTTVIVVAGNVTVSGGTLTTGGVAFSVSGTTTVSSGTLSLTNNTGAKTFTGLVTVSGGTLSGASTQSIFQGGITQTSGTVSITGTATFVINSQDLNGTMSIGTVTVTGVTLTNYGTLTITAALSGTGGLTNETTGTVNYTVTTTAPAITTLTATATGNTFNYSGASNQTCKVTTYYHLGLGTGGTKTCAVTTVNGNFTISGTAIWTTTSNVAIGGNLSVGGGTSVTTGNFAFSVTGTSGISGLFHLNGTGSKSLTGLVTVSTGGTFDGNSASILFAGGITHTGGSVAITGSASFVTNDQAINGTVSISTVIITGVTLTNNGTFTISSNVSGTGGLTQGASSNLNLGTNNTVTTFTADASGNTVTYTSTTGSQTVKSTTYRNLTISKTGQVATLGNDISVLGNLSITAGTLDVGSGLNYDITLGGNWSNSGTFTARSGTVTLNGSSSQTISGTLTGTSAFATLIITNTSGVDDPGCGTSFTPGIIFTASASATNYEIITGSVRIQYLSGGTYTFTNINWDGQTSGTQIYFRNSDLTLGTWALNVSGTQTDVSYVNTARSDATPGDDITASNGTNTDCNDNVSWNFAPTTLSVDIVDVLGGSVVSPSMIMSALGFSLNTQTAVATLGTTSEKIRITNTTATPSWTLTIAATSGASTLWSGSAGTYDFNDPTAQVTDGADADSVGGQLTIDPSTTTITPQSGCSTTGLTQGSISSFSQGSVDAITLLSAGVSADTACYWDVSNIGVQQTIPVEQPSGTDYTIDMTLTLTAS